MENRKAESRISYHLDENEFYLFLNHERVAHPQTRYATEKAETITHAPGNLRDKVKKAKLAGIHGVWEDPKVVTLVPLN